MAIQKTSAIVLKTQAFRTSSLIITFFTRDYGKLRTLAKGVRQDRETRAATYELFTQLEIVFYEKTRSDLHLLSEAFIMESYDGLHGGLESIAYGGYFAELVDELSEVHDPHEKIFDLLDFCYQYLPSIPARRLARIFEIKVFQEIGWMPFLSACLKCERKLESGFFSARQGMLLCPACASGFADVRPLGAEALSAMRYYQNHSLEEAVRLALTPAAEEEFEGHMERFLADRLHRPLKTRTFLEKIRPVLQ